MKQEHKVTQPPFYNSHEQTSQPADTLEKVHWFNITALGDQAALLAPSDDVMHEMFSQATYKIDPAKRCRHYQRKYSLGPFSEGSINHFYEYAYEQAQKQLSILDDDLSEALSQLKLTPFEKTISVPNNGSLVNSYCPQQSLMRQQSMPPYVDTKPVNDNNKRHLSIVTAYSG
jgi:hypothetical protein